MDDKDINWNDMRFLLALERSGSALKAAKSLHVSHQTVSRRLAELEKNLGARLVDRSGLNWQLTVAGQDVAQRAEEMENAMRAAALRARIGTGGMAGRIRITSAGLGFECFILPALKELQNDYPLIEFDLIADNAALDIQSGQFDIAIRFVKSPPGHLLGKSAGALEFALYGLPELIAETDTTIRSKQQVNVPVITLLNQHLNTEDWLRGAADLPNSMIRVSDLATMVAGVKKGVGIGFLPMIVGQRSSQLVQSVSFARQSPFDVWVLTNEDSRKSAKVRVVAAHFHRVISDALQQVR